MKLKTSILLSCAVLFFSCRKHNNTFHDYISGSWKLTQVGVDMNNNEVMETSEMFQLSDTGSFVTVFYSDGTGYGSFNVFGSTGLNTNFSWSTDEHTKMLTVNTQDSAGFTAKIFVDSDKRFHLLNSEFNFFGGNLWMVYDRQ